MLLFYFEKRYYNVIKTKIKLFPHLVLGSMFAGMSLIYDDLYGESILHEANVI